LPTNAAGLGALERRATLSLGWDRRAAGCLDTAAAVVCALPSSADIDDDGACGLSLRLGLGFSGLAAAWLSFTGRGKRSFQSMDGSNTWSASGAGFSLSPRSGSLPSSSIEHDHWLFPLLGFFRLIGPVGAISPAAPNGRRRSAISFGVLRRQSVSIHSVGLCSSSVGCCCWRRQQTHHPSKTHPHTSHAQSDTNVYTGAGGDNGIGHNENWLRFPTFSYFPGPTIFTRTRTNRASRLTMSHPTPGASQHNGRPCSCLRSRE
jgi:hypothetical protein